MLENNGKLGGGKIEPVTLDSPINQKEIDSVLFKNVYEIEKEFKRENDKYKNEIIHGLKKNKEILFKLNKHEEIYCNFIKNNYEKLFKYIVFRYKFRQSGLKKIVFEVPLYLLVEPVSTCNLRCPFCFQVDKSFTRKPFMGVMSFDLFKKVIDEANQIGVGAITLGSRGEPTLHKKYANMLEYIATKKNIYEVKTNTNATFLNSEICHAFFKNNVNQVVISADHYIKEDYERLRKGANFEKIINNVDMLFNIRKEHYPNSITEIRVSGIDNEKNLDRKKFENFWKSRSDHVTASYPLERWDTYANKKHPEINDACYYLWDRMYVWFDGKVNPCDSDYKSYLSFGNVKDNSIKEIWKSEKISNFRKLHINHKRNEINPCDRCGVTFK